MTVDRAGQTTNFENKTIQGTTSTNFYHVSSKTIDGVGQTGAEWTPSFEKWNGYYRQVPEFRAVIDKLASWTFGRGIKADKKNKEKLDKFTGWAKDSPRLILKNQWRTALICGDSFAEIIKDKQGRVVNLKPLNPSKITILVNKLGRITGYQHSDLETPFAVEDIFHLSNSRLADEVHGIPFAEALISLIEARNEAIQDLRILYHRNIKPINWIEVETDDTTKLSSIEATINTAYQKTENIIIPSGVIKEIKQSKTPHYQTLDSLNFVKFIVRQFVTACGVPEVVMGWGSETTEASSKIIYLAFQQEIEDMQLYIQEMVKLQLNIEIDLEFPASLEEDLKEDQKKDKGQMKETNTNPNKDG